MRSRICSINKQVKSVLIGNLLRPNSTLIKHYSLTVLSNTALIAYLIKQQS